MVVDTQEILVIAEALRASRRRLSRLLDDFPAIQPGLLGELLDELTDLEGTLARVTGTRVVPR